MISTLLNKLIDKKYYEEKQDIIDKCSVFFAMNVINETDYATMMLKIEEVYYVPEETTDVVEEPIDETTANDAEEVECYESSGRFLR